MDRKDQSARNAAAERARECRDQAAAFDRLAATEPLEHKRTLLLVAARRFQELAHGEDLVANGRRRDARHVPRSARTPEAEGQP